jgi:hypothetical protein
MEPEGSLPYSKKHEQIIISCIYLKKLCYIEILFKLKLLILMISTF